MIGRFCCSIPGLTPPSFRLKAVTGGVSPLGTFLSPVEERRTIKCHESRASPHPQGRTRWRAFPPEIHGERDDAPLTLETRPGDWLDPGEEAMVRLHPLFRDLWPPVVPGIRLTMLEGACVVGVAEVVEAVPASG